MAVVVVRSDDLSGAAKAKTVEFGFDGVSYEIDLTEGNKRALAKSLNRFISVARVVPPKNAPVNNSREAAQAIRTWGNENGFTVHPRGRISAEVIEAYFAQDSESA